MPFESPLITAIDHLQLADAIRTKTQECFLKHQDFSIININVVKSELDQCLRKEQNIDVNTVNITLDRFERLATKLDPEILQAWLDCYKKITTDRPSDDIVQRANSPLRGLEISYEVIVDFSSQLLDPYHRRLVRMIDQISRSRKFDAASSKSEILADGTQLSMDNGIITAIKPQSESKWLPQAIPGSSERTAWNVVSYYGLEANFYRENKTVPLKLELGIEIITHMLPDSRTSSSDPNEINKTLVYVPDYKKTDLEHEIKYDISSKKLHIIATYIPTPSKNWINKGVIVSIPDLVGAILILQFSKIFMITMTALEKDALMLKQWEEILRTSQLSYFSIDTDTGQRIHIDGSRFERQQKAQDSLPVSVRSLPIFIYKFPNSLEQLRNELQ